MAITDAAKTTQQKLSLFRECFSGLTHVYGTCDPQTGRARQVKRPVTARVLLRHLTGREPYGVYLLVGERTGAVVADFDQEDPGVPLRFIRQARHHGLVAYLERSKSKGWHAWIFAEPPGVSAAKARRIAKSILNDVQAPSTEVFPKQDCLHGAGQYGNFIYAPLFGALVPEGRTVFVDPDNGLRPYGDQWALLAGVKRVGESLLDELIETNGLGPPAATPVRQGSSPEPASNGPTFGLPPCARAMLAGGVTEYQRVACFRLAVHLKKAGLPQDVAVVCLTTWAAKNHPKQDKQVLTDSEVCRQTHWAYAKPYRTCGCEDPAVTPYCDPNCPLFAKVRRATKAPDPPASQSYERERS